MAAGILAAPGTKYGPCEGECKHIDCASTRTMAQHACPYCGMTIGYGERFYRVDQDTVEYPAPEATLWKDTAGRESWLAHADCHEDELSPDNAARRTARRIERALKERIIE